MRFASYNIQYGLGRDERCDLARIARGMAGADVIALQEVERFAGGAGRAHLPRPRPGDGRRRGLDAG